MQIVVAGYGSAGQRFAKLAEEKGCSVQIYDPVKLKSKARKFPTLLRQCDAAIICSPPSQHYRQAADCLRAGVPVLIEKPVATEASWAADLIKLQKETKTPAFIGYNLRFVSDLARLISWAGEHAYHAHVHFSYDLRAWRPNQPVSFGYAPWRAQGGGILLDASHEIDTAVRMFGRPRGVSAFLAPLRHALGVGDTEGAADLLLHFERHRTVSIHLDYYSAVYRRSLQVYGAAPIQAVIGLDQWSMSGSEAWIAETYERELSEFIRLASPNLVSSYSPIATLADGLIVLEIIDAARRAMRLGRVESLDARKGRKAAQ